MAKKEDLTLVYSKNTKGIQRKKHGRSFVYYNSQGKKITDSKVLERIKLLGIPPAYTKVWICPLANGYIQAVGRDDKNRKQYIYHPLWVQMRQEQKFKSLLEFGRLLSVLRETILKEITKPPSLNKEQIICSILFLVDNYSVRIGNKTYAKLNQTYGITTLRKKHVQHSKNHISFKFLGKNKHLWQFDVKDSNIMQIIKQCSELPGYELFKYYNEQKQVAVITAQEVNDYLCSVTKAHLTAKDFRTWIATREFFNRALTLLEQKELRIKHIKETVLEVATLLGHTPTICKASYIHPQILEWLKNGQLKSWLQKNKKKIKNLNAEQVLLLWLEGLYPA